MGGRDQDLDSSHLGNTNQVLQLLTDRLSAAHLTECFSSLVDYSG